MNIAIICEKNFDGPLPPDYFTEVWLSDSKSNRAWLREAAPSLTAPVFLFTQEDFYSNTTAILQLVAELSNGREDWKEISLLGLPADQALIAEIMYPAGKLSGIYLKELDPSIGAVKQQVGFALTKEKPLPRKDMMAVWQKTLPPKGFLPITKRVLSAVEGRRTQLVHSEPHVDWVASFDWGNGATFSAETQRWMKNEARFALGFSARSAFPPKAIETRGGIEIVFRLGSKLEIFKGKAIDCDKGNGFFLIDRPSEESLA